MMIRWISLVLGFLCLNFSGVGITAPEEGNQLYLEARKYAQGNGCPIDEKKAKALYLKAADMGDPKACALKACWIFFGMRGFEKNESQANRELQALVNSLTNLKNSGDEDATLLLAVGNLISGQPGEEEIAPIKELALSGKPEACGVMSWVYSRGMGTYPNLQESYVWAKKAADKGYAEGMCSVGKKLLNGKGVPKDVSAALAWIKQAADKGLPEAQNELGNLYCQGKCVPEDAAQSTQWLMHAADQEFPEAEFHLARHFLKGRGVPADAGEAQKWLRLAIAHGQKNTDELDDEIQAALVEDKSASEEAERQPDKPKSERAWRVVGPFDLPAGSAKDYFESFAFGNFPASMDEGKSVTLMAMTREVKKAAAKPNGLSFDKILGPRTNCYALARLEFDGGTGGRRLISVGSDDAVKIWLNGKEVHCDWISRSLRTGEDLVLADFQPGKNDIAVMIQNFGGPWGMAIDMPDAKSINGLLAQSVIQGDTERAGILLEGGGDPNGECVSKVFNHTEAACFMGRERLHKLLEQKGGHERWYHPAWYPRLASLLLSWIGYWDQRAKPGISILMTQNGKPLLEACFGMSHIETRSKITPETRFPIGSITKHFVAAAILRLQEEGKLQLTNQISLYLPSFPRGEKIKIRQLLDHSSGIYNYTSRSDFAQKCDSSASGKEILRYISEWPFGDFPGRRFEYSNSNYYLAGLIVEKVSGQPLGAYLRQQFFEPLGMKRTSLGVGDELIPDMASPYAGNAKRVRRCKTWNLNWAGGAGGIVSTPRDMSVWMESLHGGKLLKPESMQEMLRVETNTFSSFTKPTEGYACGLLVKEGPRGNIFISHTGYLPPYRASTLRVANLGVNVILMGNGDFGFQDLNTDWLQAGLLALFFKNSMGASTRDHEPVVYPPAQIVQLTGVYDDGRNLFRFGKEGQRWILSGTKNREPMRSIGTDEWVCRDCGRIMNPVRNSSQEVVGIKLYDGGSITHAVKKQAWDPEGMESMRRLVDYPGKYDFSGTGGILSLEIQKGKLVGDWSNGSRVPFDTVGRDEFVAPGSGIRLAFDRDAGGNICRVIMQNDGYTWEGNRKSPPEFSDKTPVPHIIR